MQCKRIYNSGYPIFRTLGIPSGFLLALAAVLNPSLVPPKATETPEQIEGGLREMFDLID